MARTAISPAARAVKVSGAVAELPYLITEATRISEDQGYDTPDALAAWETVENAGATVHRQARLLAGKNRGG